MLIIQTEDLTNVILQVRHLISIALTAKAAEAVDILADLGGSQVHAFAQLLRGNGRHTDGLQFAQMTIVTGQTADHRVRNMTTHVQPSL